MSLRWTPAHGGDPVSAPAHRVLVVDDDRALLDALELGLSLAGFEVAGVEDGPEALRAVRSAAPALVVLDIGLPSMTGIEVCQRLRADGVEIPVLVLSARDEVEDRVAGLRAGADDYLVKPFHLSELEARIEALLRRRVPAGELPVTLGPVTVDPARRRVLLDGEPLELTRREFDVLELLAVNRGLVLSRRQILEHVWGYDFSVTTNVVDVVVSYLRRKLEPPGRPRLLHTVRGVGYVLRL